MPGGSRAKSGRVSHSAPADYAWWLAGRSAGIVAMLLIVSSVILGLAMAARVIPQRRRAEAVRLHQHLALISLGAIAAHGALLAADPWLNAGLKGLVVPFAIGYRPLWTGLGIIGAYLAVILGLSFYVRRRIRVRVWRKMHRFTVIVYVLALAHALGSGTDAAIPLVRYTMLASSLPVLFLLSLRLLRHRVSSRRRAGCMNRVPVGGPETRRMDRELHPVDRRGQLHSAG
jgi:sulfoxide reductase heme-binding subunit YedZ